MRVRPATIRRNNKNFVPEKAGWGYKLFQESLELSWSQNNAALAGVQNKHIAAPADLPALGP